MKAQLSMEFMVITLISVIYLTTVFSLYVSIKGDLEIAADKKTSDHISQWIVFISGRPSGTEINLDFKTYPRRWVSILCEEPLQIGSPTTRVVLDVLGSCSQGSMNFTGNACMSIEKTEGGVFFENC